MKYVAATDLNIGALIHRDGQNWLLVHVGNERYADEIRLSVECVDGNVGQAAHWLIKPDETMMIY